MNKWLKIILLILLALALVLIAKIIYFEMTKTCCAPLPEPPVQNTELNNIKIVYSSNNGSLPPEYYRENTLTIETDDKGEVKAEYAISDYKEVLQKESVKVSKEQLSRLMEQLKKINPESKDDENSDCTGGTTKSLKVTQGEKILAEASAYNCASQSSNQSLEDFSAIIEEMLSNQSSNTLKEF